MSPIDANPSNPINPIDLWTEAQLRDWSGMASFDGVRRNLERTPPTMLRNDPDHVEAEFNTKKGIWRTTIYPGDTPMQSRVSCTCPSEEIAACIHLIALALFIQKPLRIPIPGPASPSPSASPASVPPPAPKPTAAPGSAPSFEAAMEVLNANRREAAEAERQRKEAERKRILGFRLDLGAASNIKLDPCRLRPLSHRVDTMSASAVGSVPPPFAGQPEKRLLDEIRGFARGNRFSIPVDAFAPLVPAIREVLVFVDDPLKPLTWKTTPARMVFTTADSQAGFTVTTTLEDEAGTTLPLSPRCRLLGSGDGAWVYDGARTLWPIQAGAGDTERIEALLNEPQDMPAALFDMWCNEFHPLLQSWGEVRIGDNRSPIIHKVEPEPTLLVEETPRGLRVTAAVRYPPLKTPTRIVETGLPKIDRHWYLRDPEAEKYWVKAFADVIAGDPPVSEDQWFLWPDRASWMLDEVIPNLDARWVVIGRDEIRDIQVRKGDMEPRMTVSTGVDWFETSFEFTLGEETFDGWELLKLHDQGKRYKETATGYVRLPRQWLTELRSRLDKIPKGGRVPIAQADLLAEVMDGIPGAATVADPGWREMADGLAQLKAPELVVPPAGLQAELRDYQQQGLNWLACLARNRRGGILADDMGLGKTLQTISFLLWQKEQERPTVSSASPVPALPDDGDETAEPAQEEAGTAQVASPNISAIAAIDASLVVAPSSVVFNWEREVAKFAPQLKVVRWTGDQRSLLMDELETADIVLTSYGVMRRDIAFLAGRRWRSVILDEAQAIKNHKSQTAECARVLSADFKLALSGTPIENHLVELWSYFAFIMPGFFGSESDFQNTYVKRFDDEGGQARAELRERIAKYVLRRLKQDVAKELPPKSEIVIPCELEGGQRNLYETIRSAYKVSVFDEIEKNGLAKSRMHVLEALLRLRQACCHPGLVPYEGTGDIKDSAKVQALFELVDDAVEEDHKMIVFSQFTGMLDVLEDGMKERGVDYVRLDGSTQDRQVPVERFQEDPSCKIFLISLRAGGTGLNLTAADYVVHFDPWWNPAVEDQATDRAYRIGQTRPVFVYKLIAAGTVEERMLELQQRKRGLVDGLLSGEDVASVMTLEDLKDIFAA